MFVNTPHFCCYSFSYRKLYINATVQLIIITIVVIITGKWYHQKEPLCLTTCFVFIRVSWWGLFTNDIYIEENGDGSDSKCEGNRSSVIPLSSYSHERNLNTKWRVVRQSRGMTWGKIMPGGDSWAYKRSWSQSKWA